MLERFRAFWKSPDFFHCPVKKRKSHHGRTTLTAFFPPQGENFTLMPGPEIIAGITTFMTMAYILIVNPPSSVLQEWISASDRPPFASALGTLFMAVFANPPLPPEAPGMGL